MQDYIACNKSDSVAVDAALTQYLSTADGSFSDLKSTFVTNLFSQFSSNNSSNWDPATALKALEALKVVCRQPEGCDAVYSESGIECIIKLAGLYTGMAYVETDFSVEALKILSNCILLKREDVTSMVVDGGVGETIFKQLVDSPQLGKDEKETNLMNEILKLFYNLTYFYSDSHINESQSTREDSRTINMEKYKYWIPELVKLTNTFPISNQILSPPHSFTINALMNIPLKKPEWRQELWFPKDRKIIFTLLDILESAIMKSFPSYKNVEDSNPTLPGGLSIDEGITPLMILLTCIAKYDLESRKIIKAKIAPDNIDRTKGLDQSDTLEARMIGFMTSASHNNLKTTASDLLFTVLDENGSNLVAYTGYGHAAGFLYERGLSPADPSGGTAGTNNNGAKINPITGSLEVEKDSDEEEMEEEEREREAAKLMGLMDRLNKQGVIKPVFKN